MQLVSLFTDLDECEEIDFICGLDGICVNKNGTYDCVCPEGQTRNPNDGRCEGTLYKTNGTLRREGDCEKAGGENCNNRGEGKRKGS